jgi:LemA protein
MELKVDEADSGIDVALAKRYDVLTKQLAVVKEYASHESKVLYETIQLRRGMSMAEKKHTSVRQSTTPRADFTFCSKV